MGDSRLLAGLQRLIPAEVGYSVLDPARRCSVLQVWRSRDGEEDVDAEEFFLNEEWWRIRPTHPVCGFRTRTGDWTTPLKASDFITLREFRRTAIYDAFYRGEIDRWFDFGLPPTRTTTRVFIFRRFRDVDFDERDRLVARLVRPYLEERAAGVETAARAAAELTAIEEGASEDARLVVLCSLGGVIEFTSRSARRLLRHYLGLDNGRLPSLVMERPVTMHEIEGGQLTIRVARAGELCVLLLDERDTRFDQLTPREREVLELACGKQNDAIAFELGIAGATVAKHLERLYGKLGVGNRTAAARFVNRRSPGRD